MQVLLIAFLAGMALNVANAHPHNLDEANAAVLNLVQNPTIVADYSHLNK